MKKIFVAAGLAVAFAASSPAFAYDITSTASVNVSAANIALKSHDPVAYFKVGKPVLGSEQYSAEHEGAIYRFSSAENLETFKADPAKYTPQHGGFCRMGAAQKIAAARKLCSYTASEFRELVVAGVGLFIPSSFGGLQWRCRRQWRKS